MRPDQWQRIDALVRAALELEPEQRGAFLDQECTDEDMRLEVEQLITRAEKPDSLFESPA
jgi:hypothetical protein